MKGCWFIRISRKFSFSAIWKLRFISNNSTKASRLCFGLVNNHPFIDGNKRIGAHVMLVFLALNGIELEYTQYELSSTI